MRLRRRTTTRVTVGLLAAGASLGVAAPGEAAARHDVTSLHVSLSAVTGSLPAGAGITVIQTCPKGSDLDRAATMAGGELHDPHLRLTSREYWPAGVATRYRVRTALTGVSDFALSAGAVACRIHVGPRTRVVTGTATTDLRVWGPAPSRVGLLNVTVMAAADPASATGVLRTTVRGTGIGSSQGSLPHAVSAVQQAFSAPDAGGVIAVGETRRAVARGLFASMENRYRFRVWL